MTVTFCCHMILYLESGNAFQQGHIVLERCALVRHFSIRHQATRPGHTYAVYNNPSIVSRATFIVTQHHRMLIWRGCCRKNIVTHQQVFKKKEMKLTRRENTIPLQISLGHVLNVHDLSTKYPVFQLDNSRLV